MPRFLTLVQSIEALPVPTMSVVNRLVPAADLLEQARARSWRDLRRDRRRRRRSQRTR